MTRQLYRGKILEHYKEPRRSGTLDDPDATVEVSNPHCGDELRFSARDEDGTVTLRFDGDGCALSIAAASLLAEAVDDGPVDGLEAVANDDVFDMLGIDEGSIAPIRRKCVLLPLDGIERIGDQL